MQLFNRQKPLVSIPEAPGEAPTPESRRKQAFTDLTGGIAICAVGLAFSFASYFFASAGGRYVITTGAIIWGAYTAFKGIYGFLKLRHEAGDRAGFVRTAGFSLCGIGLFAYLVYLSLTIAQQSSTETYQDTPQDYSCELAGLRQTIPAGFSAIDREAQEETDSTYAAFSFRVYNDDIGFQTLAIVRFWPQDSIPTMGTLQESRSSWCIDFFDDGITEVPKIVEVGGREMLRSAGHEKDFPGMVCRAYDIINGTSLITLYFRFEEKRDGKPRNEARIDEIMNGLVLSEL